MSVAEQPTDPATRQADADTTYQPPRSSTTAEVV
jgi:hypothetical protein